MALITIRKAHVKRIFPTDDDGSPQTDSDVWIDVLRVDEYSRAERPGEQGANYLLKWQDGPDNDMQEGFNTTRQTEKIKVFNPQDDTQFIEVLAIKKKSTTDPEGQHQVSRHTYDNSRDNKVREVYPKRIGHIDVPDSLDMTAETPSWADYLDAIGDGDRDLDQYVDFDIPHTFRHMDALDKPDQHQIARVVFNTKDFAKAFADIPEDADPDHPPVRLDPFQYIVNVSWQAGWVITSAIDDGSSQCMMTSQDGIEWTVIGPVFDADQFSTGALGFLAYASGDGKQVAIGPGSLYISTDGFQTWTIHGAGSGFNAYQGIAFGKIDDPDNPGKKKGRWVAATGVGDLFWSDDAISWNGTIEVYGFPSGAAVRFANGRFYVLTGISNQGYSDTPNYTEVYWSDDGVAWNVSRVFDNTGYNLGNVGDVAPAGFNEILDLTYDKDSKLTVIVGQKPDFYLQFTGDSYINGNWAASAISTDGASWGRANAIWPSSFQFPIPSNPTSLFTESSYANGIARSKDGLWVASGLYWDATPSATPPQENNEIAVSGDAQSWTVLQPPIDPVQNFDAGIGSAPSTLNGIVWTGTRFIATTCHATPSGNEVRVWTSEDGTSWVRRETALDIPPRRPTRPWRK